MKENTTNSQQEISLEPTGRLVENAEEIAEVSKTAEKYIFCVTYEAAEKAALLSEMEALDVEILSQSDLDSTVTVRICMAQLAAIKSLNCIEKVETVAEDEAVSGVETYMLQSTDNDGTMSTRALASELMTTSADSQRSNKMETAINLSLASWRHGYICCPCEERWYKFIANVSNAEAYTIYTIGTLDTIGYLYDSNGNLVAINDDHGGNVNFSITEQLICGATYYVCVKAYASNTGSYNLRVEYTTLPDNNYNDNCSSNMLSAKKLDIDCQRDGQICCSYDEHWYSFTPPSSAYYTIYTLGSLDTVGFLYDVNCNRLNYNDDGGSGLNFKMVSWLTKSQTYYIKVKAYGNNTGSYSVIATDTIFVESIAITQETVNVNLGDSITLIADVRPPYATNKNVRWASNNSDIASVKATGGLVIAQSIGNAIITATSADGSQKCSCCTVHVDDKEGALDRKQYGSLEYQGVVYDIHVPNHLEEEAADNGTWNTIDKVYRTDTKFDCIKFISGIEVEDEDTGIVTSGGNFAGEIGHSVLSVSGYKPAVGLAAVFAGVLNALNENINNVFVRCIFQENNDGQKRVIIEAGSSDVEKIFANCANNIPLSVYFSNSGNSVAQMAIENAVESLYEKATGNKAEIWPIYDCEITIDKHHRYDDGAASYLWINKNGALTETPIVYPNDKVAFGIRKGFWVFSRLEPFATVKLLESKVADEEYQELFKNLS